MTITEDVFYNEYKPQVNVVLRKNTEDDVEDDELCAFNGCVYETYGEELDYVMDFIMESEGNKRRVWTVIDGDGDDLTIVAGFRFVNRFGYLITEKEWDNNETEVEND